MSVVSACPPILPVSDPVSIPSVAPIVMLLSLKSIYLVSFLSTSISLPGEVSTLIPRPAVVKKVDVIRSFLPAQGHVRVVTVAEAVLFRMELDLEFSDF